jgi:membrane dipeptidase
VGVGVVQLAYNIKNRVGNGCEERTDAGLSRFGVKLIARLHGIETPRMLANLTARLQQ